MEYIQKTHKTIKTVANSFTVFWMNPKYSFSCCFFIFSIIGCNHVKTTAKINMVSKSDVTKALPYPPVPFSFIVKKMEQMDAPMARNPSKISSHVHHVMYCLHSFLLSSFFPCCSLFTHLALTIILEKIMKLPITFITANLAILTGRVALVPSSSSNMAVSMRGAGIMNNIRTRVTVAFILSRWVSISSFHFAQVASTWLNLPIFLVRGPGCIRTTECDMVYVSSGTDTCKVGAPLSCK